MLSLPVNFHREWGRKYENLIQVPIPINYVQAVVFTKDVTFPVRDWYSLKPYKTGIVKGIIFVKEGTRGMDVLETDSYEELVDRLEAGDIEIAVMPRISVLTEIKRQKPKDIKELEGVLETLFLYHYVHKKHAALVPKREKNLIASVNQ